MDIKLSISLLASDRRESLIRCLDSLKPLLSKIPSELIVVFTGTDENVRKTAEAYTSHLIRFPWCADFSAARNAGLREACGEWFLYIDDDEWFEDVEEICQFFQSGEYRHYRSAHYIQRNYQNWNGTEYSDFSAFRMVRRIPETRFQNPIHEELVPRMEPCKYFQTYVHHYGYADNHSSERRKRTWNETENSNHGDEHSNSKKVSRNLTLLQQDIKKRPSFLKNYLQIAKEFDLEGDAGKAEEYCRKGRSICEHSGDERSKGWLQAYLSYLLSKKPRNPQALQEIEEILTQEHPCELVSLILYQHLIHLCAKQEHPKEAVQYGEKFERLLEDMDKKNILWKQQSYGEFDEAYVKNPERLYSGREECISCALEIQNHKYARYFLGLFPWETEILLCRYYPVLERWKEQYGNIFVRMLLDVSDSLEDEGTALPVYLLFQRVQEELCRKDTLDKASQELYAYCMEHTEEPYLQSLLLQNALCHQLDLSPLADRMDLNTWEACISKAMEESPYVNSKSNPYWKLMEEFKITYPLHALCLESQMLEQRLIKSFFMWDDLTNTLREFCTCILEYYQRQYRKEMFTKKYCFALPKKCRFAMVVLEAMEAWKKGQLAESTRLFRSSLHLYPPMTGLIREFLRQAARRIADPALHAGDEFQLLARQMKETLSVLMNAGEYVQAEAVLKQLLALMPEDLELIRICQELIRRTKP